MKKFDYLRPKTLEEALSLLNQHGKKAKLIAGGGVSTLLSLDKGKRWLKPLPRKHSRGIRSEVRPGTAGI